MASRIGKAEWAGIFAVMGIIDLVQFFGDLFLTEAFAAPEAINEVADPFIGAVLGGYFQFRGVDIMHQPKRLLSLVGVTGLEELTGAAAPAWIFDVWYIYRSVRSEEAALQEQREQEEWKRGVIQKARAVNFNGTREPSEKREVGHISPAPSAARYFKGVGRPRGNEA
jgi:hypothetical protein